MHASTMPMIAVVAVAAIAAVCLVPSAMPAHAQAAGSPPVPAGFVDPGTDPQTYVDRYHNEPSYKEWFDNNYSQYDSIYHAVGLPDPDAIASEPVPTRSAVDPATLAPFVDPAVDPQTYVDRYDTEPTYREWFDANYLAEYGSIYDAVGVPDPYAVPSEPVPSPFEVDPATLAPFVDPSVSPWTYVDRYLTDTSYKEWYDANYLAEYGSIYDAVGIPDPDVFLEPVPPPSAVDPATLAPFVDPAVDPNTYVDRYFTEPSYREWFDANYLAEYGSIHDAVGILLIPASFVDLSVDPQTYVDRYNTEPSYREWFDTNYSQYDSIYHAVGLPDPAGGPSADFGTGAPAEPELPPPVVAPGVELPPGLELKPGQEYGECGEGTELANGYCVIIGTEPPEPPTTLATGSDAAGSDDKRGGGCLIATAAYGSEMAPQVQLLREIRDGRLAQTQAGSSFVEGFNAAYYSFSPHVADYQRENPAFRDMVRTLLTPMLYTLGVMEHAGSESEVLAYGIAALLAISMMYVGAPVLAASYMYRYYARYMENGAVARGVHGRESRR